MRLRIVDPFGEKLLDVELPETLPEDLHSMQLGSFLATGHYNKSLQHQVFVYDHGVSHDRR